MLGNRLLRGEKVYLHALKRDQMPTFAEWFKDLELLSYLTVGPVFPQTLKDEENWYDNMVKDKENKTFGIYTIKNDQIIGSVSLMRFDWRNHACEFGIAVGDKAFWGGGYGTDATRVMVRFGFLEMNLNRIELSVYSFNERAIRAYEKVGFTHEVTRREAAFRDGQYHDIHIMSMLREEWSDPIVGE